MYDTPLKLAVTVSLAFGFSTVLHGASDRPVGGGSRPLVVPTEYLTIQAAIDAAEPGQTVKVLKGIYTEQLVITRDVAIVGAGKDVTVIRAPAALVPGQLGFPSIVEVYDGAKLSMSRLTVSGPGA